jgi:hypothetical protein
MQVTVKVTWDSAVQFQEASLLEVLISCDDPTCFDKYQGQLERADVLERYISWLFSKVNFANRISQKHTPQEESAGRRVYQASTEDHIPLEGRKENIKTYAYKIQQRHYIAPRNEEVRDEQYYTFFRSDGGGWKTTLCSYPHGTYSERLEQTIYEMEHGRPNIFGWTNVHISMNVDWLAKNNPEFKQFVTDVLHPIYNSLGYVIPMLQGLKQLAAAIAEYKQDHHVNGL